MSRPVDVRAMQVRFFELIRKRVFMDVYWVPTEAEASRLYVRAEPDRDGQDSILSPVPAPLLPVYG